MRMRSLFSAVIVAPIVATIAGLPAVAADLLPPPKEPEVVYYPEVESFGDWYLRGSIGLGGYMHAEVEQNGGSVYRGKQGKPISVSVGAGIEIDSNWRTDFTIEYFKHGDEGIEDRWTASGGNDPEITSIIGLVNAYYDFVSENNFYPFFGGSIGLAYNHIDISGSCNYCESNGKLSLAGAFEAGIGYDFGGGAVEAGYRGLYRGSTETGGTEPLDFKHLISHEVRGTVRYRWDQ